MIISEGMLLKSKTKILDDDNMENGKMTLELRDSKVHTELFRSIQEILTKCSLLLSSINNFKRDNLKWIPCSPPFLVI